MDGPAQPRGTVLPVQDEAARQPAGTRDRFRLAADSLDAYQDWKRERRLVDFVDQETQVLRLLSRPEVRERLAFDVHLVLVDEFQDTSPLELAVFLSIASVARRSLWVGDPKQSIYGFRGADARLMKVVLEGIEKGRTPEILSTSRRSRPALVHLTSALFVTAFGNQFPREQVVLDPAREEAPGLPPPVHTWLLESKNRREVASAMAAGVANLLGRDGGAPGHVSDRATFAPRSIRPGDIAVLCRSNDHCAEIARALEALGIRTAPARKVGICALSRRPRSRESVRAGAVNDFEKNFDDDCRAHLRDAGGRELLLLLLPSSDLSGGELMIGADVQIESAQIFPTNATLPHQVEQRVVNSDAQSQVQLQVGPASLSDVDEMFDRPHGPAVLQAHPRGITVFRGSDPQDACYISDRTTLESLMRTRSTVIQPSLDAAAFG